MEQEIKKLKEEKKELLHEISQLVIDLSKLEQELESLKVKHVKDIENAIMFGVNIEAGNITRNYKITAVEQYYQENGGRRQGI